MGTDRYKRHPRNRDDRDDRRPLRKKKKERRRRRDDDRSDDDRSDYSDFDSDDDRRRRRRKRKERAPSPIKLPHQNYNQCPLCEDNEPPLWKRGYVNCLTDREPDYPRLDDPAHINYQGPELPDAFAAHYQPGNYCFGTAFREAGYVKPPPPVPKEVVEEKEDRKLKKRREKRARKEKEKREKPVRERKAKARDYRTFRHRHDKYDDDSASDEAGSDSDSESEDVVGRVIIRFLGVGGRERHERGPRDPAETAQEEGGEEAREEGAQEAEQARRAAERKTRALGRGRLEEIPAPRAALRRPRARLRGGARHGKLWGLLRLFPKVGAGGAPRPADRGLKDFERSMARCMAERGF